jgi:hypothetical protein
MSKLDNLGFKYSIVFLPYNNLETARNFYNGVLGLPIALEQSKCLIFHIGTNKLGGYWGFCIGLKPELLDPEKVCLTLVVSTREEVDQWYKKLSSLNIPCKQIPSNKPEFHIYNVFFKDPMNYTLEIQTFDKKFAPR